MFGLPAGLVFFASAVFAWTTDTARQAVELIEGEEARQINMKFHVEQESNSLNRSETVNYISTKDSVMPPMRRRPISTAA